MFLCPLETLRCILLANQLAIGTASECPAQSSAAPEDCFQSHAVEVERATEPRLFHSCPSSAAQRVIFVGRPEPDILLMLFVSVCFCRNLCTHIRLAIKPSSRNMWQIAACSPFMRIGEFVVSCSCCTSLATCEKQNKSSPKATLLIH